MKAICTTLLFLAILHLSCGAQAGNNIEGIWKGTSLCQLKPSPCHDENVVYYISKNTDTTFTVRMSKILNGVEEDMGDPLNTEYDQSKQTLTATTKDRQGRQGVGNSKLMVTKSMEH